MGSGRWRWGRAIWDTRPNTVETGNTGNRSRASEIQSPAPSRARINLCPCRIHRLRFGSDRLLELVGSSTCTPAKTPSLSMVSCKFWFTNDYLIAFASMANGKIAHPLVAKLAIDWLRCWVMWRSWADQFNGMATGSRTEVDSNKYTMSCPCPAPTEKPHYFSLIK